MKKPIEIVLATFLLIGGSALSAADLAVSGNLSVSSNAVVYGSGFVSNDLNVASDIVVDGGLYIYGVTNVLYRQTLTEGGSILTLQLGDERYLHGSGAAIGSGGYASPSASGAQALAVGAGSVADGNFSISAGEFSWAGGYASSAFGSSSVAGGYYSGVLGLGLRSQGFCQMVVGKYNVIQGDSFSNTSTDNAFIVGNGTSQTRSDALRVTWAGDVWAAGGLHVNGATRFEGPVRLVPQGDVLMGSFTNAPPIP